MENNNIQNTVNQEPVQPVAENKQGVSDKIANKVGEGLKSGIEAAAKTAVKTGAKAAGTAAFSALSPIIMKVVLGVLLAGLLGGGGAALVKFIKKANELKIADTPTIVKDIKKISEFTTYTYIEEFVIKSHKAEAKESAVRSFLHAGSAPDSLHSNIVFITRGVVRAGYNLAKISENDLKVSKDTVAIKLPSPEIFDVIINPSNYEVFVEEGTWSHEEITALQVNCQQALLNNAIESGILEKAASAGKEKLTSLFMTFGFNEVQIAQ